MSRRMKINRECKAFISNLIEYYQLKDTRIFKRCLMSGCICRNDFTYDRSDTSNSKRVAKTYFRKDTVAFMYAIHFHFRENNPTEKRLSVPIASWEINGHNYPLFLNIHLKSVSIYTTNSIENSNCDLRKVTSQKPYFLQTYLFSR